MSFSKENRKNVFDFFVKILLTKDGPVYYEQLRGHVSQAHPDVRRYVQKKCKGEQLLEFFQKRKNYFVVDHKEVSLKKRYKQFVSKKSLKSEEEADFENEGSEELSDYECSDHYSYDRSSSFVSSCQSKIASTEGDESSCSDFNKEMIEYEEITMDHFIKYLTRNEKLNLCNLEFSSFPKKVQRYLAKYMKKKAILFFQSYPDVFHLDECCIRLVSGPLEKETFSVSKVPKVETSPDVEELEQSTTLPNFKEQTVNNFLHCAEFFVSILKKKSTPIYADKLSGHLSQAPKEITAYLKHNYKSYKYFFLDAPKLFIFNELEQISASGDSSKLLKRARKLSRQKLPYESSVPFMSVINSLFELSPVKKSNPVEIDETCINVSDIEKFADINVLHQESILDVNNDASNPFDNMSEYIDRSSISALNEIQGNLPGLNLAITDNDKCNKTQPSDILVPQSQSEIHIDCSSTSALDEIQVNLPLLNIVITDNDKCNNTQFPDILIPQSSDNFDVIKKSEELTVTSIYNIKYPKICSKLEESSNCVLDRITKLEETQKYFKECLHTVQLMCLEIVEKELKISLKFEFEAVEFFIKILKNFPGRWCDISTLQGNLGQAPRDIISFMNNLYKAEKFEEFFEKRDEFVVYSGWRVELSPNFQDHLNDRLNRQKTFTHTELYFQDLCDSHWNNMCIQFFEGLHKIFSFLQNKEKAKISRLSGRMAMFPTLLQNFINSLNPKEQTEKIKQFLEYFNFFIFTNDYVSLDPEIIICSAMDNLRKYVQGLPKESSETSKLINIDYSLYINKDLEEDPSFKELCDLKNDIVNCVKDYLSFTFSVNYSDLLKVLGSELFHSFDDLNLEFLDIIIILFESNLFQIENGEISLKKLEVNETEILDANDFVDTSISELEIKSDDIVLSSDTDDTKDVLDNLTVQEIFCKEKVNQDSEVCLENNEMCCDEIHLNNANNNVKDAELQSCTTDESHCQDTSNQSRELELQENELCDETALNDYINGMKENVLENFSDDETISREKNNQDFKLNVANNQVFYSSETNNSKVNSDLVLVTDQINVNVFENTDEGTNTYIETSYSSLHDIDTSNEVSHFLIANTRDVAGNCSINPKEMADVNKQYKDLYCEYRSTNNVLSNLSSENIEWNDVNIEHSYSSSDDIGINSKVSNLLIVNSNSNVTSSCSIDPKEEMVDSNMQHKDLNYENNSTNHLPTNFSSENVVTYDVSEKSETNDNFNEPSSISSSLEEKVKDNKQYENLNYESSSTNHLPANLTSENIEIYDASNKSETNFNFNAPPSVLSSENIEGNDVNIEHLYSSSDDIDINSKVSNVLIVNRDSDVTSSCSIDPKEEMVDNNMQYKDLNYESSSTNHLQTNFSSENVVTYDASDKSETNDNFNESISTSSSLEEKVKDNKQYESGSTNHLPTNLTSENIEIYDASNKSETNCNFNAPSSVLSLEIMKDPEEIIPHASSDHLNNDEYSFNSYIDVRHFTKFVASSSVIFLYPPTPLAYINNHDEFLHDKLSSDHLKNYGNSLKSDIGDKSLVDEDAVSSDKLYKSDSVSSSKENATEHESKICKNLSHSDDDNSNDKLNDEYVTMMPNLFENSSFVNLDESNDRQESESETYDVGLFFNIFASHEENSAFSPVAELNDANSVGEYNDENIKLHEHDISFSKNDVTTCELQALDVKTETINAKDTEFASHVNGRLTLVETFDIYRYASELENVHKLHCEEIENHDLKCVLKPPEIDQNSKININNFSGQIDVSEKNDVEFEKVMKMHSEIETLHSNNIISDSIETNSLQPVNSPKFQSEENTEKQMKYPLAYNPPLTTNRSSPRKPNLKSSGEIILPYGNENKITTSNKIIDNESSCSNSEALNKSTNYDLADPVIASNKNRSDGAVVCTIENERLCSSVSSRSNVNESERTNPNNIFVASNTISHSCSVESEQANHNSNFPFMQPLSAKVILLSMDSCIVETVLHGQVKLVFCLKASFHCDRHNNCLKCFESLEIGDRVSCYMPPMEKNSNLTNMYFSFMLCKEPTSKLENSTEACHLEAKKLYKRYQSPLYDNENNLNNSDNKCDLPAVKAFPDYLNHKHYESKSCQTNLTNEVQSYSSTSKNGCLEKNQTFSQHSQTEFSDKVFRHCPSVEKECQVNYSVDSQNCQTELSGNIKICSSVVDKECQAKCSQLSQIIQTLCESGEIGCQTELSGKVKLCSSVVENECQAKWSVLSQMTQTICKFNESSCQTKLSGNVKLSPPVLQKECQAQCSTSSTDTQIINKNIDGESQTNISGSIKCCFNSSSLACQTILSGRVKKCVSLENKSCQSLSMPSLDQSSLSPNMFSTPKSNIDLPSFNSSSPAFQSFDCSNGENVAREEESSSKELCDTPCQTISTGAIMIKKYYL